MPVWLVVPVPILLAVLAVSPLFAQTYTDRPDLWHYGWGGGWGAHALRLADDEFVVGRHHPDRRSRLAPARREQGRYAPKGTP